MSSWWPVANAQVLNKWGAMTKSLADAIDRAAPSAMPSVRQSGFLIEAMRTFNCSFPASHRTMQTNGERRKWIAI
jgi:hypothetical protein